MKPKQILVVDDWPEILHLLEIQLSHLGWDPVLAESGREALEKLKGVEPWLILLDIRMPDMDGLQLVQILKNHHRGIPVVAMTAFACPGEQRRLLEAGCHDWLSKPFTVCDLGACLSRVIGISNLKSQMSELKLQI